MYVWSVSGEYDRQLLSLTQFSGIVRSIAVDTQGHVMYVGRSRDTVDVFELTYEPL